MAHELFMEKGRASMMYTGEVPWHGLGTRLDRPATAAEAIKEANLDWRVTKLPLFGTNGVLGVQVKGKYAVVREDQIGQQDAAALGIVSDGYTLLQNEDAFSFFDLMVKDKEARIYHTAGALGNGERIWILAKLPGYLRVAGDDIANKFLLLSNSHDGSSSVRLMVTPIRVVCNNTLNIALEDKGGAVIHHTKQLFDNLQKAGDMLASMNARFTDVETTYREMASVQMNTERLNVYLSKVFPEKSKTKHDNENSKVLRDRKLAEHLFAEGKGNNMPGVKGTLWAAYNGVTELVDYGVPKAAINLSGSRRLNSIWFGEGASIKSRAYKIALERKSWLN
ncbi:MAG: DUF932 domain-containing protein [Chloracidobacterium sp.]|nr:DUF932 domain-containing protein [Chloracidobacterium sp.]